jgi:hypothetical protein
MSSYHHHHGMAGGHSGSQTNHRGHQVNTYI